MKLHIWAALSIALASARSGNASFVSYTPQTTIAGGGPRPSNTLPVPPAPTNKVPSVPPSSNSYKLNSSFEISATPVTRTYNWTIGYLINSVPFGIYLLRPSSYIARSMALQAGFLIWFLVRGHALTPTSHRRLQSELYYHQRPNAWPNR